MYGKNADDLQVMRRDPQYEPMRVKFLTCFSGCGQVLVMLHSFPAPTRVNGGNPLRGVATLYAYRDPTQATKDWP
jgi:hypothetical protein